MDQSCFYLKGVDNFGEVLDPVVDEDGLIVIVMVFFPNPIPDILCLVLFATCIYIIVLLDI